VAGEVDADGPMTASTTCKAPRVRRDPTMQRRLAVCLERLPSDLVVRWPETGDRKNGSVRRAAVFVHGTLSCCLAHLPRLDRTIPAYPDQETIRYEHDTFLTIEDNAADLVAEIRRMTASDARVVLVGHSRGGLVARVAAGSQAGGAPAAITELFARLS